MRLFSKDAPDSAAAVRAAAYPLTSDHDHERILAAIGDASLVLIGEATHGTHEFYSLRARITRALIEERGFSAVAIEGDWPDAYRGRIHRTKTPERGRERRRWRVQHLLP